MIQIAVLGYGTVGSGVVEVLHANRKLISKRAGDEIQIKYVLDLRDFPGDPIQEKIVHDYEVILQDPEVRIVVEVMGGTEPAYTFVKKALLQGKSVCTSNKELVAEHGVELLEIAREKNINFLFEASCGGGIPIIRPLHSSLTADEIEEITGILNGTTNYILSRMDAEGSEFDAALKEAQERGYAERNPGADIEGWDACRKIAILSSIAFGHYVDYQDIPTEGITHITSADIKYARNWNASIKLLAVSQKMGEKFYARVSPVMINSSRKDYFMGRDTGKIHIYCGDGKGKTTTGMGLCTRAAGFGYRVLIYQFMKDNKTSERAVLEKVANITFVDGLEKEKFSFQMTPEEKAERKSYYEQKFREITEKAEAENYDILFLDELIYTIRAGLFDEEILVEYLKHKPEYLEVILTGQNPGDRLIQLADYVSEIRKMKHPFDAGLPARKGIEK